MGHIRLKVFTPPGRDLFRPSQAVCNTGSGCRMDWESGNLAKQQLPSRESGRVASDS